MTLLQLIRRNLRHHRRANFAVLLGVAVGTAVLTGALLVGDSLRGSLSERALERLGGIEEAMVLPRFIRAHSKDRAFESVGVFPTTEHGIMFRATVEAGSADAIRRATDVSVVTKMVWRTPFIPDLDPTYYVKRWTGSRPYRYPDVRSAVTAPEAGQAWVSPALASDLGLTSGQSIRIRVPRVSAVSRESWMGRKTADDLTQTLELRAELLATDDLRGLFSLEPSLGPARTIFVNRTELQEKLGLIEKFNAFFSYRETVPPSRPPRSRFSIGDFGIVVATATSRVESILRLLDRDNSNSLDPREYRRRLAETMISAADTNRDKALTKDELAAYFTRRGTTDLEAEGLLLPPAAEQAALSVAIELNIPATSTLVYLANSISDGDNEIPYSVIAAVDPQLPPPLGPYLDPREPTLADDEILLADWPESPLSAKVGDTVTVRYFLPESDGKATETSAQFKLRGKVPLSRVGADPYLAPEFPGITDKLTLGEWDPPFPYDNSRIKRRDEDFWDKYRATPKAYVNKATGRKLFGSRFGYSTSVRFAATSNEDVQRINDKLLEKLKPEDFGLVFEDVRAKALAASQGGTDFGGLFLGFSFFLIAGALMLVGLLWKLNLDKRASEIGLLFASGFRVGTVRRLLLCEGLVIATFGALLGLVLAIGYGLLMLKLLAALWPDEGVASFLTLHIEPQTSLIGLLAMLFLTGFTIWWSLRSLRQVQPAMLLRGVYQPPAADMAAQGLAGKATRLAAPICTALGVIATISGVFIHDHEARAGAFFSGGGLLLIAGLLLLRQRLRAQDSIVERPATNLEQLGRRNIARHPGRSLLTAGLIASATFLLVAVESFRRNPATDFGERTGGSGGFDLIASMDVPLYQDLNDPATGRKEALDALERVYQKDPPTKAAKLNAAAELFAASEFIGLRMRSGDDAGCRNLSRPDKPRLLGVPSPFIDRGGFQFASLANNGSRENPWAEILDRDSTGQVPVFGEANTVQWMLKKSLGQTLPFKDSHGNDTNLRIVGLLQDSIFQGELVMSEKQFLQMFPETQGYGVLLAKAPKGRADELRTLLETAFADRGLAATSTADKLRSYLAVENTYLSTFQILGGFGLLLGACGLAVVMLRNAVERRGELALLRALGLSPSNIGGMIRAENFMLLAVGIGIGATAALISIAPLFISGEASGWPLLRVAGLLACVIFVGSAAGALAIRSTVRAPIVPALRSE